MEFRELKTALILYRGCWLFGSFRGHSAKGCTASLSLAMPVSLWVDLLCAALSCKMGFFYRKKTDRCLNHLLTRKSIFCSVLKSQLLNVKMNVNKLRYQLTQMILKMNTAGTSKQETRAIYWMSLTFSWIFLNYSELFQFISVFFRIFPESFCFLE